MAKHFKNDSESFAADAASSANSINDQPSITEDAVNGDLHEQQLEEMFGPTHNRKEPLTHKQLAMRIIVGALIASIVIILGVVAYGAYFVHTLNRSMSLSDHDAHQLEETLSESNQNDAFYVALLGSDAREGDYTSRADVNMLMRVDTTSRTITLISVPRDMQIDFAGQGVCKINAAYAYNGPAGAVSALRDFSGVDINHYAQIHFDELIDLIDLLGGVEVYVPESFTTSGHTVYSGMQTLDGYEALAFTRNRYQSVAGDFGRAQAQRIVVEAIINKVLTQSPAELPHTITAIASCFSTDFKVEDIVSLASKFQAGDYTIYSAICPSYSFEENGVSYVGVMYDEWRTMMCYVDAGMDPASTEEIPKAQLDNKDLGSASNAVSTRDYASIVESSVLTTDDVVNID